MLVSAYKTLMKWSTPLLEAYLSHRMRSGKEDISRIDERRGLPSKARGNEPLVWFHAASVGEAQSLLVLIRRLLDDYSDIQVMVTTGTVTSARLLADRLPSRAFHQYMPVDHPDWTEKFLNYWRPDMVIWSESEFWPNMLTGIQERSIPAVLLNARISQKSFFLWHLARGAIGSMLSTFQLCLGQNQEEVVRLRRLGASEVRVSGNLKYAAAPLPCNEEKLEILKNAVGSRPLVLWASTHLGEEEIAFRVHKKLSKLVPKLLTIIVPRHPKRGRLISGLADLDELSAVRRSKGGLPQDINDLYIADTLGELGLFYRLSRVCVLGGSFMPVGGHNPIEPAQLGCQIFYGPHMFNFLFVCEDFENLKAVLRVENDDVLVEKLAIALRNPEHFSAMSDAAKDWTQRQVHIVDETIALLVPFMDKALTERKVDTA
ncbi:MAG: 3-deoxy-D-manno-octulosonic acid transferase [Alphaproteobacteria bacterium]|nr:3-deoxy-D-manno-octulosonic acid transferase [Alphaproteobacteria bacterium]MCK5555107.1 3-deoxy-D-manno-octulosonic acid transferase [Alphaproteobacteria bacterium]MCK5658966.1 3-deoxy-D-manno-octulosonic acid transferase [Alphaproteobacteria bacterium]